MFLTLCNHLRCLHSQFSLHKISVTLCEYYRHVTLVSHQILKAKSQLQNLIRWPLAAQPQNQSRVTAGEMRNERSGTATGFSPSFFSFTLLIIILPLLHNVSIPGSPLPHHQSLSVTQH